MSLSSRAEELCKNKNIWIFSSKRKGSGSRQVQPVRQFASKEGLTSFCTSSHELHQRSSSRHEMGRHFTWCCSNPTFKLPFRGISRQTSRPSAGRSKRSGITVARPFHLDGQHQCWVPVAPKGVRCWENYILTKHVGYLVHAEGRWRPARQEKLYD